MLDFSTLKSLKIGGVDLVKLTINGVLAWKKGFKNWAFNSLEAGGASIYNGGLGYKIGYRVRSGGVEAALSSAICTGFIPFKNGDTLRIYPPFTGKNSDNAINFSDENFENLGQVTDSGSGYGIANADATPYRTSVINGISTLTLNAPVETIRYVRITHYHHSTQGVNKDVSNFIITVNEEFEVPV